MKIYQTNNFYLSSILLAKGIKLVNIDRNNPRQCQFVFEDSPQRQKLVEDFLIGKEILIDAKVLIGTIKDLKDKLYLK